MTRLEADNAAHLFHGRPFGSEPVPVLVTALVHAQALRRGATPYLTAVSGRGVEQILSYRDLDLLSGRLAAWFRSRADAGLEKVIALSPTNDISSVLAIFALLRSGATMLLLNPTDPPARKQLQVDAAGAIAAFRGPGCDEALFPRSEMLPAADALPDAPFRPPVISPGACSFLIGTSGSTAASKLVAQMHANAAANAAAAVAHHRLTADDRFLGCLPIHHVNGLHFTLFANLSAGSHVILLEKFEPFSYLPLIERYRPRIASVVPSLLEALVAAHRGHELPDSFGYFVSAAAPLPATTARRVMQSLRRRIVQGYGLTETTNFSCTLPPDMSDVLYRRLVLDADIPSVGTALGNEVAILAPDGTRLPSNTHGEICMRGHNVMRGYAGNDEATAEAFRHGWFHSLDLGFELQDPDDGRSYFVITGRAKNMVKVRGETVSLDEIDAALRSMPGVIDAACVARPHQLYGEVIVVAVVESEPLTDADIRAHLGRHLSPAAQPASIVRRSAIPRTATGKIRRGDLAEQLQTELGGDRRP
jgi:acyl-CoA synthetase (AMP-forming)/AMP-acid ligase II